MEQQVIAIGTWWLVLILMAPVVSAVVGVLVFIRAGRRSPPLPEELYRDFVRRPELDALEHRWNRSRDELRSTIHGIFAQLDSLQRTLAVSFKDVESRLSELKGVIHEHIRNT